MNFVSLIYWTAIVLLLITIFCSIRLRDSRLGRAWIAIREDEVAAAAMGIPLMRTKTWAYAIGRVLRRRRRSLVRLVQARRLPGRLLFNISIFILCMVILGGMGNVWGVDRRRGFLTYLNQEGLANMAGWINEKVLRLRPERAGPGEGRSAAAA